MYGDFCRHEKGVNIDEGDTQGNINIKTEMLYLAYK